MSEPWSQWTFIGKPHPWHINTISTTMTDLIPFHYRGFYCNFFLQIPPKKTIPFSYCLLLFSVNLLDRIQMLSASNFTPQESTTTWYLHLTDHQVRPTCVDAFRRKMNENERNERNDGKLGKILIWRKNSRFFCNVRLVRQVKVGWKKRERKILKRIDKWFVRRKFEPSLSLDL